MQVTVYGAGGKVGQEVVRLCLERGHSVTAMVHRNNPFQSETNLTVVMGDIYSQDDVVAALTGSQAVISTLGSWHTKRKDVLKTAMQVIIPAMEARGIQRIITVTGSAALWERDRPGPLVRVSRSMLELIARKILHDGEAHLALLAASKLDWTCLRSSPMTNRISDHYALRNRLSLGLAPIPRLAVATAMVDQLDRGDFSRQAPVIYKS